MSGLFLRVPLAALALCLAGCGANYTWRSSVPDRCRSVTVSTFRNESSLSELGAVATRQIARELQREGTFRLRSAKDAALEIQGVVKSISSTGKGYSRLVGEMMSVRDLQAVVEVSVVDRQERKVLVNARQYVAQAKMTVLSDETTGLRDTSGRLMEDLARQVVDDLLNFKW